LSNNRSPIKVSAVNYILGKRELSTLTAFSKAKTALVFDYDGTLVPIVDDPFETKLTAKTEKLLKKLTKLYPCAVLSGRSLVDVKKKSKGMGFRELVGNHGMEFAHSKGSSIFAARASKWVQQFAEAIREGRVDGRGLQLEDKIVSISIHYRGARNPKKSADELQRFFKELSGLRLVGGKLVFNLLPNVRKNKGTAIGELRKLLKCDHIVYVGDDVTDEDVFMLKNKRRILDIRVGKSHKSHARYYLHHQAEVDELLAYFIELRSKLKSPKARGSVGRVKVSTSRL
jgi:trehalose 6-phosphate phosphatase